MLDHRVELRPIDSLAAYPGNAKRHPPDQIAKIAASMRSFGFTYPILVDSAGVIIAGHGRLEAARSLGAATVPVMVATGWTEDQVRAYRLADNRIAEDGDWDEDLLRVELTALTDAGFDTALTGFSEEELAALFGTPADDGNDPDAAPAPAPVVLSQPGDVWTLGPHRIVCGDSRSADVYAALLGTEKVDAVWTDPPYNVAYQGAAGSIANDSMSNNDFALFLRDAFTLAFASMKPGAAIYVAHADTEGLNFRSAFTAVGLKLSGCIIWAKDSLVLGRSDYQWQHEPILYGWRPGAAHRWHGGRKLTTIAQLPEGSPFVQQPDGSFTIRIGDRALHVAGAATVEELIPSVIREARPRASADHPTMKPVALIERTLGNNVRPGDLVLDPFAGSGSTLIAADRLGCSARVIELDPRFVDVVVRRWQEYSGREAVHATTGETFANRERLHGQPVQSPAVS
jgi:DNA modification methylase